ncbi:TPA: hypothetical protein ACH3X2_002580 [Trebouxia sp. C0005]
MLTCNGRFGSLASKPAKPCPVRTEKLAHPGSTVTVCWQPALFRPAGNIRTWRPRLQRAKVCHVATVIAETQQEQESPRSSLEQRRVVFRTTHQVQYGDVIKVIGQGPQLGKWEVGHAPAMEWSEGDKWSLEVDLSPGVTDFKCAVVRQNGSVVCWEPGANRTVEVPHVHGDSAIQVKCTWSNTGNTVQALSMDEDDTADFVADSMDEEDHHGTVFMHSNASGSVPNSDTESPVVPSETGEQQEGAKRQGEFSDVDEADMEKAGSGQMDKNKERVQQAGSGGREATTSLPGKQEQGQRDQSGLQDDNAQKQDLAPGQGVQLDEVEGGKDELKENPASSRNPKEGLPKAFTNHEPASASSASSFSTANTGQLAVGLLGLFAVPVVAWSEYTLRTTGCGLPPGPGGLLGATEGLSYLTVGALAVWSIVTKISTGHSLPKGPAGLLAGAEKLAFTSILAGVAVLGLQVKDYGYIPAALPDSRCFGDFAPSPAFLSSSASSSGSNQQAPTLFVSRLSEMSQAASQGSPFMARSNLVAASPSNASPATEVEEDEAAASAPSLTESAAQSTEAARKGAKELFTTLRATYNSVAETISELDFSPLGRQAIFVKDTLGAGFAGLGKSAALLSQQLAQDVTKSTQAGTSELQNRSEEVYSGAVDGLSSSDINSVVEEIEHEADVLKRAFQKALHRAMGSVALLGAPSLQDTYHYSSASTSAIPVVQQASMTHAKPVHHRRVLQPLLGGVSVHQMPQPQMEVAMVAGCAADQALSSQAFFLPAPNTFSQAPSRRSQPLWDQQEVALRVLELSVRSMSVPLAQVSIELPSLDLHRLLVEANMMMMGAAATNAVSAANNVNATLGNAIQQLRVTVDTLKQTVNDVCTIAHRDRVDLNRLYKAVANLDMVLGGAKLTASSVELTPLAAQLDDAAASIKANESGVEAEQLAGRLVKAAMSLRDTSSSLSVTATLENAQRIVSKIPETAANEEDIAPLLQEFEDLTSQLQAELDKLSAVTNNLGPSSL